MDYRMLNGRDAAHANGRRSGLLARFDVSLPLGLWLLVVATLLGVWLPVQAVNAETAPVWQEVSGSEVKAVTANPVRNRRSNDATVSVAISNIGGKIIPGPLRLVIGGLTPSDKVSIGNATGKTSAGDPYFDLAGYLGSNFAVGGNANVNLVAVGGGPNTFSFTPRVERQIQAQPNKLSVQITSPATLLTVGATPQRVQGTVSDPSAQLTLNGAPVANNNGTFAGDVALDEGHNTVTARATNSGGEDVSDVISLSLDVTPPYITVESPKDGDLVRADTIAVSGLVNDIVRGTVAEGQANVRVNGKLATVSNRSYLVQGIALNEGPNAIVVAASDNVGNSASRTIQVTYRPLKPQRIELVSGQAQTAKIGTALSAPLKVKLLDEDGNPAVGKPVVFRVTQGDGTVGVGTQDVGQATLSTTDTDGIASTTFKLGSRAGTGNQRVRGTAVGFDGEALFYATATVGAGSKVSVNSGNNQRAAANQPLPQPLVVTVVDDGANVVAGAQIEFKVEQGGGIFQNGQTRIVSTTDSDGRAVAEWTLGSDIGLDVHRVTATLVGTNLTAGFTASALASGNPGQTAISGVVLDNQEHPLEGVTLRVDGTTREARSDAEGQFKITEVPVGAVRLVADGSTTTAEGEWPTLSFNLVTVAGANNPLPSPIYLVKLDTVNAKEVGNSDVTLTLPEVPGFALDVKAGSVTFPDGRKSGKLSVTPVDAAKIPMPPPNGMQPQFIVTIQPVGAKFDPPARLTLPNVDGHAPGAQVEMYSYDHDLEEFVAIGLGTVSADGSVIRSNEGVGVIKAGWHCGSQPGGSGCCSGGGGGGGCPVCKKSKSNNCSDSSCENDDSQDPGECKKCSGGAPVNDDSEDPGECKSCKNGKAENDPDGASCDDKKFCTSADGKNVGPDKCTGGKCEGKKVERKKTAEKAVEVDFTKYVALLEDAVGVVEKALKNACKSDPVSIKGQRKEIDTEECCETQQKVLEGKAYEENITVEFGKQQCSYYFPPIATPVGPVIFAVKASIAGQGKGYAIEFASTCDDPEQCNKEAGVQISGVASAGLELAYIHPNVLSGEGQGRVALSGSFAKKCDDWKGKACAGPFEVRGTVKALSFLTYSWSHVFKDSFICTGGGTVPQP